MELGEQLSSSASSGRELSEEAEERETASACFSASMESLSASSWRNSASSWCISDHCRHRDGGETCQRQRPMETEGDAYLSEGVTARDSTHRETLASVNRDRNISDPCKRTETRQGLLETEEDASAIADHHEKRISNHGDEGRYLHQGTEKEG